MKKYFLIICGISIFIGTILIAININIVAAFGIVLYVSAFQLLIIVHAE